MVCRPVTLPRVVLIRYGINAVREHHSSTYLPSNTTLIISGSSSYIPSLASMLAVLDDFQLQNLNTFPPSPPEVAKATPCIPLGTKSHQVVWDVQVPGKADDKSDVWLTFVGGAFTTTGTPGSEDGNKERRTRQALLAMGDYLTLGRDALLDVELMREGLCSCSLRFPPCPPLRAPLT